VKEKVCSNCEYFERQSHWRRFLSWRLQRKEGRQFVKISGNCTEGGRDNVPVYEDECACAHWIIKGGGRPSPTYGGRPPGITVNKPDFFLPEGEKIMPLKPQSATLIFELEKEIAEFKYRYMLVPLNLPLCPECKGYPLKNCEVCKGESQVIRSKK
jgi:hypothetical protein